MADRPNLMIKIPGTLGGPAISSTIASRLMSIATLLFGA